MDRLLIVFVLLALLLVPVGVDSTQREPVQSAFFSLLFPQLMPDFSILFGAPELPLDVRAVFL